MPEIQPDGPQPDQAAAAPEITMTGVWAILRRLGPTGPLAIIASTLPAIGGFLLLGTLNLAGPWLRSHDEVGVAIYIAGFAILAGLALLPTYAQAILGGWAFGFAIGFPAALLGFGGAALLGYIIARQASGQRVIDLINEKPKWKAVYDALAGSGFWKTLGIVTLLRVPPTSPFALTNLVMAATRVHPLAYMLGTLIGMAPRTGLAVYWAARAAELDLGQGKNIWFMIIGIVLAIIVLAIIGQIANNAIARVTGMEANSTAKE